MYQRQRAGEKTDQKRRSDAETRRRRDLFPCVSLSRRPRVRFFLCVLCVKNLPEITEHKHRQWHTEKQAALGDKQNLEGITPAKLVANRIFLRQVPQKIHQSLAGVP